MKNLARRLLLMMAIFSVVLIALTVAYILGDHSLFWTKKIAIVYIISKIIFD